MSDLLETLVRDFEMKVVGTRALQCAFMKRASLLLEICTYDREKGLRIVIAHFSPASGLG